MSLVGMPAPVAQHGGPGSRERRDVAARSEREAVAAFFDIHPAHLAGLPASVVALMAARLEGNRARAARLLAALGPPHRR